MTAAAAPAARCSRGSSSTSSPRRAGAGAMSCTVMLRPSALRRRVVRRTILRRVVLVDRDRALLHEPRDLGGVLTRQVALATVHVAVEADALLPCLVLALRVGVPPDVRDVVGTGVVVLGP